MFVPYIARRSINIQHYALNYITSLCTQLGSTTNGTTTLRHTGHINLHNNDIPPICSAFQVTNTDIRSSLIIAAASETCRSLYIE
jgi:hypothetical protein